MSFPLSVALNGSQQVESLNVLHDFVVASVVPMALLESFLFGACTAGLLIGSYMLCFTQSNRIAIAIMIWCFYAVLTAHWVLCLRQMSQLLSGSAMGLPLSFSQAQGSQYVQFDAPYASPYVSFNVYATAWRALMPIVGEITLLGFATVLLMAMLLATLRRDSAHLRGRSRSTLLVPAIATLMYALALTRLSTSLVFYERVVKYAQSASGLGHIVALELVAFTCLTLNITLGDAIVLWRMCIVWEKSRYAVALSVVLNATTAALGVANVVQLSRGYLADAYVSGGDPSDSRAVSVFARLPLGLAAVLMSLASNVCATALVGLRYWLYRKLLATHAAFADRRTLVGRVMELIVDSGVVYTTIWIVYVISFFKPLHADHPVNDDGKGVYSITSADYFDAAMSPLTTIYPLAVFLLVAISKELREFSAQKPHGPDSWEGLKTIDVGVGIERSMVLNPRLQRIAVPLAGGSNAELGSV